MVSSLGICLAVLLAACEGGEEEAQPTPTPTPSPAVAEFSPTPTPSQPVEGAFELVPILEWATFDRMLGFSTIPGSEGEAVVVTQGGMIWWGSVEGDSSPTIFGDISDRLIESPG
ncbi:unnamed protein product, partial [marine sediment metagenome]